MNVYSFLTDAATRWPDTPAVLSSTFRVTFAQLLDKADCLRRDLIEAGLRPGMGLGLVTRNSSEFVVGLFAGLGAGAVVMPISHQLKEAEFRRVVDLVPVAAILHDGSLRHEIRMSWRHINGNFHVGIREKEFQMPVACGVPDAAVVRFTSGTTGSSKGVVLSHQSVFERTEAARDGLQLSAGDRVTWVLPMAYHFIVSILTYVRYGVTLVLPTDAMPEAILNSTDEFGSNLLYASPLIVQMLASDQSGRMLPPTIRVISTSSGLTRENAECFTTRFGMGVGQVYGVIEVGLPIGNLDDRSIPPHTLGKALPKYEVGILDALGNPVPSGEIGRLAVRGPGMFDAYLAPFRPRREVLHNNWFLTGDLATSDDSGVVAVCGREKSVINTAGNKVFPEEIEAVLNSYPGVRSARAFGIPHTLTGEVVAAEIVPSGAGIDLGELRRYCYEKLSPYKVPKELRIVDGLPITDSGKIVRAA